MCLQIFTELSHAVKVMVSCPVRLYKCHRMTGACCYFSLIKEYELRPKYNKLLVGGESVICLFWEKKWVADIWVVEDCHPFHEHTRHTFGGGEHC